MKRVGSYAILLLLAASLGINGFYFFSQQHGMTVVDVHDGDTFTLGSGDRVRLLGADAPELSRCGADEAKKKLSDLVLRKTVKITEEKRDTYGRRMGLVYVGTTLVNEVMLKEGLARPDYTKNSKNEQLKAAYKDATDNARGIHSSLCKQVSPTPPSPNCTIKGNIDKATWTHYYHLPNCRHYNQIVLDADMGEQFFCSEKEASAAGFTLAPDCLR
ncbi:MAG: thermonuclease family protein [Candidatus Gottesmanbacteria bacterium]|nr:thermonuclease family protein [Candidatus Gottesmanbacteria bacterium]